MLHENIESYDQFVENWEASRNFLKLVGTYFEDTGHYFIDLNPCFPGTCVRMVKKDQVVHKKPAGTKVCDGNTLQITAFFVRPNVPIGLLTMENSSELLKNIRDGNDLLGNEMISANESEPSFFRSSQTYTFRLDSDDEDEYSQAGIRKIHLWCEGGAPGRVKMVVTCNKGMRVSGTVQPGQDKVFKDEFDWRWMNLVWSTVTVSSSNSRGTKGTIRIEKP